MKKLVSLVAFLVAALPAGAFKPITHVAAFSSGPRTVAASLDLEAGVAQVTLVRGDGSVLMTALPAAAPMGASYRFRAPGVGRLVLWDCAGEGGYATCALAELEGEAFGTSVAEDAPLVTISSDDPLGGLLVARERCDEGGCAFTGTWDGGAGAPSGRAGIIIDHTGAGLTGTETWVPLRVRQGKEIVDLCLDRVRRIVIDHTGAG